MSVSRQPQPDPNGPVVVRFKGGNRLVSDPSNLEWTPTEGGPAAAARASAIVTRQRADSIRQTLEDRRHSDSAELVAEDRLR
jgi:hypothetical protein